MPIQGCPIALLEQDRSEAIIYTHNEARAATGSDQYQNQGRMVDPGRLKHYQSVLPPGNCLSRLSASRMLLSQAALDNIKAAQVSMYCGLAEDNDFNSWGQSHTILVAARLVSTGPTMASIFS